MIPAETDDKQDTFVHCRETEDRRNRKLHFYGQIMECSCDLQPHDPSDESPKDESLQQQQQSRCNSGAQIFSEAFTGL